VRARSFLAIVAGFGLLAWPTIANGYPLVFSDTGSFLYQALAPFMVWDKPWIYGPVLVALSLKLTLWLPALAQCLAVSWVLWRVQGVLRPCSCAWHVGICGLLALVSTAPWVAGLLMPDIFAPIAVLALFLLAWEEGRRRGPLVLLATFAIASHLSHLLIAAACLGVVLLLRPRRAALLALPLCLALGLLLVTNAAGHGRFGISPFGSVFALARLVADGPAREYLDDVCPGAGYRMCGWQGRMPVDSDEFLWNPHGPVWSTPGGPIALAPEAARIVWGTVTTRPLASLWAALGNMATQLAMARSDEVLGNAWLDDTVDVRLRAYYPPAEGGRFRSGAQFHDRLRAVAAPLQWAQEIVLAISGGLTLVVLAIAWRRRAPLFALAAFCVAGVLANAFATGALAGPHGRYGARVAWLLVLVPALALAVTRRPILTIDPDAR